MLTFPKALRLCRKKEITQIFAEGQFYKSGPYRFKWTLGESAPVRTVISISKRVGSSPVRNRLKRLVRESLRHSPDLKSRSMNLAIFITHPLQQPPKQQDVQRHIERFFAQLD